MRIISKNLALQRNMFCRELVEKNGLKLSGFVMNIAVSNFIEIQENITKC